MLNQKGYFNGESGVVTLDDEIEETVRPIFELLHLLVVVGELMPLSVAELDEHHEEYEE
jgi:hypothetical protein